MKITSLTPLALLAAAATGQEPVAIAPDIWQSRGVGHAHLVATPDGSVLIDAGLSLQADLHRQVLGTVSSGAARFVVLTHAHADHAGGAAPWIDEDTTVITHARFPQVQRYLYDLGPFQTARNRIYYPGVIPEDTDLEMIRANLPQVDPDVLVDDTYTFELGGTRFEVISTPGAEGEDSVSVWLPDRKILFTGDFLGPVFPMWPNLYSLRGEPYRSATDYVDSLNRAIDLRPEMLVPSHGEPVEGARKIRADLERIRDAVQYVHDAVVLGMNEGRTVYELMRDIELPRSLTLPEPHGKLSWSVRAIWEYYAGWFHGRSTTDLYPVPPHDVYRYLGILAGGPGPVVDAAQQLLEADEPVHALHLVEVALASDSDPLSALTVRLAALEQLLKESGGDNFFERMWLQSRIVATRERIRKTE